MEKIKLHDNEANFRFWGGPKMLDIADGHDMSIEKTSIMGLWEVFKNLRKIKSFFNQAKTNITDFNPDIIIFIDYPGFNLRMAKWAKTKSYKTAYYISPQIWAWRQYRSKSIKRYIDLMFIILPFEQKLYNSLGIKFYYFGHPLLELIDSNKVKSPVLQIKTIALFPGSRIQEIRHHMPVFTELIKLKPEYKFLISTVSHINQKEYKSYFFPSPENIEFISDLKDIISQSDIAVASSGTVTLQLALYNLPHLVIYKTSFASFHIAKRLVQTKYISLPNLIADKPIVKELIQSKFDVNEICKELELLKKESYRLQMSKDFQMIRSLLGDSNASDQIAESIVSYLKEDVI